MSAAPCRYCHKHHAPAGVRAVHYADMRAACDAARALGPEYVADGHAGAWRVYDDAGRVLHNDGHAYADGVGGFCYAVEVTPRA